MDCPHWYGVKVDDLDTPYWLPCCPPEMEQKSLKITLALHAVTRPRSQFGRESDFGPVASRYCETC